MEANEEYVRQRWQNVRCIRQERCHPARGVTDPDAMWFDYEIVSSGRFSAIACNGSEAEAWQAAYDFTIEREEEIKRVEEEIALLYGWRFVHEHNPAAMRILAAREAALDELKRGMR